jgi:selenocysteine lyase/cysteine desulfurase
VNGQNLPDSMRQYFPRQRDMSYFATCSIAPHSTAMDRALNRMLADLGSPKLAWTAFEAQVDQARAAAARLIGSTEHHIALLPNATLGAYQVASTRNWHRRPEILCCDSEFPSLAHVWLSQQDRGARLRWAQEREVADLVSSRSQLISVPLSSYEKSIVAPIRYIANKAHQAGAEIFVDAYQAAGAIPISVSELDCDYLVFGTMKYLLGLPGLAFLYAKDPEKLPPPELTGWFGRIDPLCFSPHNVDFPSSARKFETGTPSIPAVYSAVSGIEIILQAGMNNIENHIKELSETAVYLLKNHGFTVVGPDRANRGAHICLVDENPQELSNWLADQRIVVSPRGRVVRLAFHLSTSFDDISRLVAALRKYRDQRPRLQSTPQCLEVLA